MAGFIIHPFEFGLISIDKSRLVVQLLSDDSIAQIYAIEQQVHLTPWSVKKFQSCFDNKLTKVFGCFYLKELVGYAVLQIIEPEAELQNFAIKKTLQQQGVGSYFVSELIKYCQFLEMDKIMLEVRESNNVAIQLYLDYGFIRVGERKDYYKAESGKESALLMTKRLCD